MSFKPVAGLSWPYLFTYDILSNILPDAAVAGALPAAAVTLAPL